MKNDMGHVEGTITERNTSSLVPINYNAQCKVSKESKVMQSKPVSSVAEGLLLRREVDEAQRSSSFCTLVGIPSSKIQSTPLRLEPQVTRMGELSTEVENRSLLVRRIIPEQTVDETRSVDPSSASQCSTEPSPALTYAHTGLTQELEGLKIFDDCGK